MAEKIVKVTNRDSGMVGYAIPDTGIRREFASGETKKIPVEELKQLMYVPGGEFILKNLLMVEDKELLNDTLNIETEPEYFYTEEDIVKLLREGSMDQLADALDFAPDGVIELIKSIAVNTEIPDVRKRDLISKKTGFNINSAIKINHIMNEEEINAQKKQAEEKTRRAAPINADAADAPKRRAAVPEYKVTQTIK